MSWGEILLAFIVSHGVGDFLLQTDWQARHKHGGLGGDPVRRRALVSHVLTYTLAFVPALIWIAGQRTIGVTVATGVLIAVPHFIQDDGRLIALYSARVKKLDVAAAPGVAVGIDQSFHLLLLFLAALLAAS